MTHLFFEKIVGLIHFCSLLVLPHKDYYEGNITYMSKAWDIAVTFEHNDSNKLVANVDFIEINAYQKLFEATQKNGKIHFERKQPDGRPSLIFDGITTKDSIYGKFDGIGIEGAKFVLKPAKKLDFDQENVVFYNDTIKLSGTVLKPKGEGKFPSIVFTHGSNPDTRDVYYGFALQFVKKGIAVLIYDKRGVGGSTGGNYNTAGITGLAEDAIAGIELLKKRKFIDPTRIGIFGHSQGGWIAPMAATLSKDVSFVITSAASAISATEQSVYHRMNIMRQDGFNDTEVQKAASIRQRMNDATKLCYKDSNLAVEALKKSSIEIRTVKKEKWFESAALPDSLDTKCPSKAVMELLFKDPMDIWSKVKVPTYLVWGDKDIVVPIEKRHLIVETLERFGNRHVTSKLIPNVDHFITIVNDTGEWDFPREPKNYFSEMADWINSIRK